MENSKLPEVRIIRNNQTVFNFAKKRAIVGTNRGRSNTYCISGNKKDFSRFVGIGDESAKELAKNLALTPELLTLALEHAKKIGLIDKEPKFNKDIENKLLSGELGKFMQEDIGLIKEKINKIKNIAKNLKSKKEPVIDNEKEIGLIINNGDNIELQDK